jgi:hypothetical protein
MLPTEMGNNKTISLIVTVIVCGVSDAKVSNSVPLNTQSQTAPHLFEGWTCPMTRLERHMTKNSLTCLILRIIILVHSLALLVYRLRVSVYSVSRSIHYRTQEDSILDLSLSLGIQNSERYDSGPQRDDRLSLFLWGAAQQSQSLF